MTEYNLNLKINQKIEIVNHNEKQKCNIQGIGEKYILIDAPILLHSERFVEYIVLNDGEIYRCKSRLLGKKTENKICLAVITKPESIERIQRREYYRLQILMEIGYSILKSNKSSEGIKNISGELMENMKTAYTIDISGGGLKITTNEKIPRDKKIVVRLNIPETIYVVGISLRCEENEDNRTFRISVKFTDIDSRTRDKIIRFIFNKMREILKSTE